MSERPALGPQLPRSRRQFRLWQLVALLFLLLLVGGMILFIDDD